MKISFCIITLNEDQNLPRCLASCAGLADEIVVLDSGSSDATERIAREAGARWEVMAWQGYVAQKNRLLDMARNDWVFSIDADEEISPQLRKEILRIKSGEPGDRISGYSIPRCVFHEGRWIRHGNWYPDRKVRLWRKGQAQWQGNPHEKLMLQGNARRLRGDLLHFSNESIDQLLGKISLVSTLYVGRAQAQDKRAGWVDLLVRPWWKFFRAYIIRLGFLDGWQGYYIAWMESFSTATRYAKAMDAQQNKPSR